MTWRRGWEELKRKSVEFGKLKRQEEQGMCIVTRKRETKTADRDLRCYKVLVMTDGRWVSPYREEDYTACVESGEEKTEFDSMKRLRALMVRLRMKRDGDAYGDKAWVFDGGGLLHSFRSLKEARAVAMAMERRQVMICGRYTNVIAVFSATVPKGSVYLEGDTNGEQSSYASSSLRIGKAAWRSDRDLTPRRKKGN